MPEHSPELIEIAPGAPTIANGELNQGNRNRDPAWSAVNRSGPSKRTQFRHDSIDTSRGQIRLITLVKDLSADGLIQCGIQTVDLATKPVYRAISYVWGPETPTHDIKIEGLCYAVRENLWQFLDMYRQTQQNDSLLWIDQIAIDQLDVSERNHQVQLMSKIFGNAFQVVSWLGSVNPGQMPVLLAIEIEGHFGSEPEKGHGDLGDTAPYTGCPLCEDLHHETEVVQRSRSSGLITNHYWKRLWIIQEIVLAKELVFFVGDEQLRKGDILAYCNKFGRGTSTNHDAKYVQGLLSDLVYRARAQEDKGGLTLVELLKVLDPAYLNCTDPRDLIFGLLGMVRPSERIAVDYTMHQEEVFGALLDQLLLTCQPVKGKPRDRDLDDSEAFHAMELSFLESLSALASRLGLPARWYAWLDIGGKERQYVQGSLFSFFRCLSMLRKQGLGGVVGSTWQIAELGPLVCATLRRCHDTQFLTGHPDTIKFQYCVNLFEAARALGPMSRHGSHGWLLFNRTHTLSKPIRTMDFTQTSSYENLLDLMIPHDRLPSTRDHGRVGPKTSRWTVKSWLRKLVPHFLTRTRTRTRPELPVLIESMMPYKDRFPYSKRKLSRKREGLTRGSPSSSSISTIYTIRYHPTRLIEAFREFADEDLGPKRFWAPSDDNLPMTYEWPPELLQADDETQKPFP